MKIFITGSNLYTHNKLQWETIETHYGKVEWLRGKISDNHEDIIVLPRHGKNHKNLPNTINYLANFAAINSVQPEAVISFSVCGVLNKNIPLAEPILPNDFFFPENRLPTGEIATIFQKENTITQHKGHLIPVHNYFDSDIQDHIASCIINNKKSIASGVYVHANGPRFNSKTEIKYFQGVGGDMVSQTCGPEIVMCNELEIPFGMLCFGVDYANGVSEIPTQLEELNANIKSSTDVFLEVIDKISQIKLNNNKTTFKNFLYKI